MNHIAYLSVGSNQGDREQFLTFAVCELKKQKHIAVEKVSSIYETEPVGYTAQPRFLNAVVKIKTAYCPEELLKITQQIENKGARKRTIRFGPRTLDLDILLYDKENINLDHLQIPHPRMQERAFVIIPLLEISPAIILPDGTSLFHIYEHLPGKEGVTLWKTSTEWEEEFARSES